MLEEEKESVMSTINVHSVLYIVFSHYYVFARAHLRGEGCLFLVVIMALYTLKVYGPPRNTNVVTTFLEKLGQRRLSH